MIANCIVALLLFLQHEAFYLLPARMIVAPGVFRMADAALLAMPLFGLSVPRTIARYREESLLVISFLLMMFLSCVMGSLFFPQSYYEGILNIRNNFIWASFFAFIPLVRNPERAERVVKFLTFLAGGYVLLLLATRWFPGLGIIHLPKNLYDRSSTLLRFGEHRLFFPYGNIPLLFFFIALAQTVSGGVREGALARLMRHGFMAAVFCAVVYSMTRAVIYPTLAAVAFAFVTGKSRSMRFAGIAVGVLLLCLQLLSVSVTGSGSSMFGGTLLGKMILRADELSPEGGRAAQAKMYLEAFARSPIAGVGNFAIGKYSKYQDAVAQNVRVYGFFNGSDLGYLKILGENGLIGVAWLLWWFSYFYRRGRQTLAHADELGDAPFAGVLTRGLMYFTVYLLISGVTLGHWLHHNMLTVLPLSLALMAIARVSVAERRRAGEASEPAQCPRPYPLPVPARRRLA